MIVEWRLRESEADKFAFNDDATYEFLAVKHGRSYTSSMLLQWQLGELMHVNASLYNVLKNTGVKRRVGASERSYIFGATLVLCAKIAWRTAEEAA